MAGIGFTELLIVLVVVLVIFGAGKVPEVMRSLGTGVREMHSLAEPDSREATHDGDDADHPIIDTG